MTNYFLDTEFIEVDHTQPVRLLSIGIVSDDGREYYAEPIETDRSHAGEWVRKNVIPHLRGGAALKTRSQIAGEIVDFVLAGSDPIFWGWFADYDWLLFCQFFGRMVDLPLQWPNFCLDLKQLCWHLNVSRGHLPQHEGKFHNALDDARWNLRVYEFLTPKARMRGIEV